MKKMIMCLVVALLSGCFVLAGCTSSEGENTQTQATTETTTETPTEAPTEKELDFYAVIKECKDDFAGNTSLQNEYGGSDYIFEAFDVSADGRSMSIKCKNSWDSTQRHVMAAVTYMNYKLGFGESLDTKMSMTRAIDGVQTDENDLVKVTWTYHPDSGITVIYEKK